LGRLGLHIAPWPNRRVAITACQSAPSEGALRNSSSSEQYLSGDDINGYVVTEAFLTTGWSKSITLRLVPQLRGSTNAELLRVPATDPLGGVELRRRPN